MQKVDLAFLKVSALQGNLGKYRLLEEEKIAHLESCGFLSKSTINGRGMEFEGF